MLCLVSGLIFRDYSILRSQLADRASGSTGDVLPEVLSVCVKDVTGADLENSHIDWATTCALDMFVV